MSAPPAWFVELGVHVDRADAPYLERVGGTTPEARGGGAGSGAAAAQRAFPGWWRRSVPAEAELGSSPRSLGEACVVGKHCLEAVGGLARGGQGRVGFLLPRTAPRNHRPKGVWAGDSENLGLVLGNPGGEANVRKGTEKAKTLQAPSMFGESPSAARSGAVGTKARRVMSLEREYPGTIPGSATPQMSDGAGCQSPSFRHHKVWVTYQGCRINDTYASGHNKRWSDTGM